MSGGYWPAQRAFGAGVIGSPSCPRCGEQSCTALHMLWTCPALCSMLGEEVLETQPLVYEFLVGLRITNAFGSGVSCLVSLCLSIRKPFPPLPCLSFVGVHPVGGWSGGRYSTDGSGEHVGAFPVPRRCGFSVAAVGCEGARPGLGGDATHPFLVLASRSLARSCMPSLLCFATLLMVMLGSSLTLRLVLIHILMAGITAASR